MARSESPYLGAEFEIVFDDLYKGAHIRSMVRDITGKDKFYSTPGDTPNPEFGSVSELREDHIIVVPGSNTSTWFRPDAGYGNARVRGHLWPGEPLENDQYYIAAMHRQHIKAMADGLAKRTGGTVKLIRWAAWPQDVRICKEHQTILTTTFVSGYLQDVCPVGELVCKDFERTTVVPVTLS